MTSKAKKILKTLKEAAEFEGYMADASEEFKALEKKLNTILTVIWITFPVI